MRTRLVVAALALFCSFSLAAWSSVPGDQDDLVHKAYQTRMNGKADDARELLEKAVSEKTGSAAANFELARAKFHISLGQFVPDGSMDELLVHVEKAMEIDPDNASYALFAGRVHFMRAYKAMKQGGSGVKEKFGQVSEAFEAAVKAKPDYRLAMLYLVELHSQLPPDMGGDRTKADKYAAMLEKSDPIWGAKARSLLLSGDVDRVDYWKTVLKSHDGNADVLEELGKACLYRMQIDDGVKYIEAAIESDPARKLLLLDLGRFHLLRVMKDRGVKESALPEAEEAIKRYLETEPVVPLKAFSYEMLAKAKMGWGDGEGMKELRARAGKLDKNYSKAMAIPGLELFINPGDLPRTHRYLFRPF